jgi:hypothetical protein
MTATITTTARYLFAEATCELTVTTTSVIVDIAADSGSESVVLNRCDKAATVTNLWQAVYNVARRFNVAAQHEARPSCRYELLASCAALSDMAATVTALGMESELEDIDEWNTFVA